ncbi:hypothetical protein Glove_269g23 [Diversispora epigaea]|uniref:Uncharacterized protein n=1 Tax=Diversispora epigaea TaxID=1348612 RepID=A0A397I4M7_9GLOM|nr:hypothetical protein Glove_269g23 [Diversispora epigaea]
MHWKSWINFTNETEHEHIAIKVLSYLPTSYCSVKTCVLTLICPYVAAHWTSFFQQAMYDEVIFGKYSPILENGIAVRHQQDPSLILALILV